MTAPTPTPAHIDIKLSRPIKLGGTEVDTVRMREPKLVDQRALSRITDQVEKEINLFANLCGLAADDLNELPMRDYKKLQDAYEVFTA